MPRREAITSNPLGHRLELPVAAAAQTARTSLGSHAEEKAASESRLRVCTTNLETRSCAYDASFAGDRKLLRHQEAKVGLLEQH